MADLLKIHSAVRWGKAIQELKDVGLKDRATADAQDEKNGNTALHIAVQNGHFDIVKFLVEDLNCSVDMQNKVGNTALHMGVEYDYYTINKILVAAGADQAVENGEGAKAIEGLSGTKTGPAKWDNPVTILKTVEDDNDALEEVMKALESANAEDLNKEDLVRTGMGLKKTLPKCWKEGGFQDRFMTVVKKL